MFGPPNMSMTDGCDVWLPIRQFTFYTHGFPHMEV